MSWKKKEKPLTAEEAIALARQELALRWFGSPPLLASVRQQGKATAYPLDPEFAKQSWLLVLMNATGLSCESVMAYAHEWHRRYSPQRLNVIMVYRPIFRYLAEPGYVSQWILRSKIPFIVAVDYDGGLSEAFGGSELPKLILMNHGKVEFSSDGRGWADGVETKIQKFLRASDPGLPLSPPDFRVERALFDRDQFDFNAASVKWPAPGFQRQKDGTEIGMFAGSAGRFRIKGQWQRDADRLVTFDPDAEIAFSSCGSAISLIAQGLPRIMETTEVVVELNGLPVYDKVVGSDIQYNDEGQTIVRVNEPKPYLLFDNLSIAENEVTLKFPAASRCGVALYGVRFADPI